MLKLIKKNPVLFAILTITFIIYLSTLSNGFIEKIDDQKQILENQAVKNLSFENIKVYFSTYTLRSYQPLASLSFAIEYFYFKETAAVYHFTNVLLHLFCVFLVFKVLTQLFKDKKNLILFSTAIFALHPLQVETVAWISSRSTLLCSLFMLLSMYHYLRYLKIERNKYLAYSILFFIASLFSKSTGIIIPGILILLDIYLLRKFNKKLVLEKAPFFVFAIIFGIISLKSREVGSAFVIFTEGLGYDFIDRIMVSCYSFLFYFGKFLAPFDLHHIYVFPLKTDSNSLPVIFKISPVIVLFILSGMAWMLFKLKKTRIRNLFFGLSFYLINIFLVLNIFLFTASMASERYMYLAIIGLSICLWTIIELILEKKPSWANPVFGLVFLFLGFQIFKTHSQIPVWKNEKTLLVNLANSYKTNSFNDDSAYKIWEILADVYTEEKNFPKAVECYDRAIKFKPDEPGLYLRKGQSLFSQQRYKESIKVYSTIIESKIVRKENGAIKVAYYNRASAKELLFEKLKNVRLLKSALTDINSALKFNTNELRLINKKREIEKKISEIEKSAK